MNTMYVRIDKCSNERLWYNPHYMVDAIFLVYSEAIDAGGNLEECYKTVRSEMCISKTDCTPVNLRELDTDTDGNPLECGDEVKVLTSGFYDIIYIYLGKNKDGFYWVYNPETQITKEAIKVRKVMPVMESGIIPIDEHTDPLNLRSDEKLIRKDDKWYVKTLRTPEPNPIEDFYYDNQEYINHICQSRDHTPEYDLCRKIKQYIQKKGK